MSAKIWFNIQRGMLVKKYNYQPFRFQSGSTLIEVVIALLVITIGLLGLLSMQIYTLKGNQSAYLRSQATILAYELVDAMRAERDRALNGGFDDNAPGYRANWDAKLVTVIGTGAGANVVRNDNTVQITVTWNDQRGEVLDSTGIASVDADTGSLSFQTDI